MLAVCVVQEQDVCTAMTTSQSHACTAHDQLVQGPAEGSKTGRTSSSAAPQLASARSGEVEASKETGQAQSPPKPATSFKSAASGEKVAQGQISRQKSVRIGI